MVEAALVATGVGTVATEEEVPTVEVGMEEAGVPVVEMAMGKWEDVPGLVSDTAVSEGEVTEGETG